MIQGPLIFNSLLLELTSKDKIVFQNAVNCFLLKFLLIWIVFINNGQIVTDKTCVLLAPMAFLYPNQYIDNSVTPEMLADITDYLEGRKQVSNYIRVNNF